MWSLEWANKGFLEESGWWYIWSREVLCSLNTPVVGVSSMRICCHFNFHRAGWNHNFPELYFFFFLVVAVLKWDDDVISGFHATHIQSLIVTLKYHFFLKLCTFQRFFLCWLDFVGLALIVSSYSFFSVNIPKKSPQLNIYHKSYIIFRDKR